MWLFFQELDSLHFDPEHHPHLALQAWELICTKRCHAKSILNITVKKIMIFFVNVEAVN